jgi:outer membrane receptor protein involved in Fe transport
VGDLRLTYATPGDRLEVTLAVNNIANTTYTTQTLPYTYSTYGYVLGNPRTVLGSVKVRL